MKKPEERPDQSVRAKRTRYRSVDWRQTGCCDEAQADGVPCPSPGCDCETCMESRLAMEESPAHRRRT